MNYLLIGHLIGDFYLQTNRIASKKISSAKYLALHGILYTLCIYLTALWINGNTISVLTASVITGILHICIDYAKLKIESTYHIPAAYECAVFLADQLLHLILLYIVFKTFPFPTYLGSDIDILEIAYENIDKIISCIAAALVCGRPAAIVVSLVFKMIPQTIECADEQKTTPQNHPATENKLTEKETARIGSWIGILEREIMLILGLLGQYSAIGFVLTAKSLARYKQLENKAFAEKYLVGTLLSAFIALLCIAACSLF